MFPKKEVIGLTKKKNLRFDWHSTIFLVLLLSWSLEEDVFNYTTQDECWRPLQGVFGILFVFFLLLFWLLVKANANTLLYFLFVIYLFCIIFALLCVCVCRYLFIGMCYSCLIWYFNYAATLTFVGVFKGAREVAGNTISFHFFVFFATAFLFFSFLFIVLYLMIK